MGKIQHGFIKEGKERQNMDIYRKDGEDTTWIYEGRIGKIQHEYIKEGQERQNMDV